MAFNRTLMVIALLLLASLLAEGDAQQKAVDQKAPADVKPVRPETHGGGWGGSGGGWGGWGPWGGGGWGGGGRGGGWGGGGWGGGGHGGGGWGGGGRGGGGGGGWGGGGGCGYRCGHRCCTPQEVAKIKKIEEMNTEGRMTAEVKPATVVGTEGYGGGGWGGGGWGGGGGGHEGHGGGWGGGGGGHGGGGGGSCRYYCGRHCCSSPEEMANFKRDVEMKTESNNVNPEAPDGPQGYGGGGGGWGGGGGGWGGGGRYCHYYCGRRCCTPQEISRLTRGEDVVGTQGYGGGGSGWGGGGGHCRYYCGRRCCTPEEIANNPELKHSESEAKGTETKTVKQGEVKD